MNESGQTNPLSYLHTPKLAVSMSPERNLTTFPDFVAFLDRSNPGPQQSIHRIPREPINDRLRRSPTCLMVRGSTWKIEAAKVHTSSFFLTISPHFPPVH